jgi:ABC-type bacteriocin/lantibiotic exporter with double-glycine peptidase domain
LLFSYLGLSFFSGIGVIFLATFLNIILGKFQAKIQKNIMTKTDERMKITTESFNNIKMLKLYNWTDQFKDKIIDKRKLEQSMIRKRYFTTALNITSLYFFP